MRLLHTSDWHLGDQLGTVDRTEDQFRALDHLLGYCDEYKVDALVVAGDVFHEYHGTTLTGLVSRLAERLMPRLERGMRALFIPGNHDREYLFRLLEIIQRLSSGEARRRIHFVSRPDLLRLEDPRGVSSVQFVLLPYPTADRYLPEDVAVQGYPLARRRQEIALAFANKLSRAKQEVDPRHPSVLVSHIYVRTAETSSHFRMSENDDIPIEPQEMPDWAYVALGHIHKPQVIGERNYVRYSGSLERLDLGEQYDEKSCVLANIGVAGLDEEPTLLPLPTTPIYSVDVKGSAEIDALTMQHPDRERALVHLRVGWQPGEDNPAAILSQLQRIFPRCFKFEMYRLTQTPVARQMDVDPRDQASTVRAFLQQRLEGHNDRERLVALANELVEEVQSAATAS